MNSRNIQIVLLAALTLTIAACDPSESVEKEATEPGYLTEEMPPCTPVPGTSVDPCEAERQGAFVGEARRNGSPTIVAYVNGHPITAADIAEGRARAAVSMEWTRDRIANPLPADGSDLRENLEERIRIIEEHGVDAAVLTGEVYRQARYAAATAAGHSADPAEVAARVAETKAAFEDGLIPGLGGYLEEFDKDVYFDEVLPANAARELTVASWRGALAADAANSEEARSIWRKAEAAALKNVTITLTGNPGIDTTVEKVKAYMDAYWVVNAPPAPSG